MRYIRVAWDQKVPITYISEKLIFPDICSRKSSGIADLLLSLLVLFT